MPLKFSSVSLQELFESLFSLSVLVETGCDSYRITDCEGRSVIPIVSRPQDLAKSGCFLEVVPLDQALSNLQQTLTTALKLA